MHLKRILSLCCCGVMALQLMAAGPESARTGEIASPPAAKPPAIAKQLEELRQKIADQEKEIERLQKSVTEQRALLESTAKAVAATALGNNINAGLAPPALQTAGAASTDTLHPFSLSPAARATQSAEKSPLSFRIGNADFKPFGFMDLTFVSRSTNTGSGIGTGFGSIPYTNSPQGHLSENNLSAQNSRIGLQIDSTVLGGKVLGYLETDFLGNQPANVWVTSNANTLRMRNYFVDIRKGIWEVMGGQDWSLTTPGKSGVSPVPSDIFYTQNMDTNYQVGLPWARQAQFRVALHPNNHFALALSLENPQQYIGGVGVSLPSDLSSTLSGQFNDGTTNYKAASVHPDVILKAAFDAKPAGLHQHLEAVGFVRSFKDYTGTTHTTTGGGGELNGNFEIFKNFHLIANTFFSDGGGRYIYGLGPDLIVRPDGAISLVHTYATVDGFEANVTKNLMLYSYYGGAYFGKNTGIDANGKPIGFGYAGSANSSNRTIQEYTIGLQPTFWKSPLYGSLGLNLQYSYIWRNPWYVAPGNPKNAKTNMVYVNLRYTLP
jgi:hypothetical protein